MHQKTQKTLEEKQNRKREEKEETLIRKP